MKILMADDHEVVRRGVAEILRESLPNPRVDEVSSAQETLKAVGLTTYDIVLLDIHFPDGSGLDVLQQIRSLHSKTRVLLFSMYPEEQYARRALRLGAAGYLTKDTLSSELSDAIRQVAAGGRYISQTLAELLVDEFRTDDPSPPHESLSDREFQVLIGLAAGQSVGALANELSLSPKTVSTYRARALEKLKLHSTAELIRYALEHGLLKRL